MEGEPKERGKGSEGGVELNLAALSRHYVYSCQAS